MLTAAAHTSDTPVWWLVGATFALVAVTAGLAYAALRALGQLKLAVEQLDEVRRDRHVQVLSDFGRRWDEPHLWEAREKQFGIASDRLRDLVGVWFARRDRSASDVPILLRVPNFFEDLSIMVEAGKLEVKYVALSMGSLALGMWDYWQPAIEKMRETAPTSYTQFEKLVGDLNKQRLE